MATTHADAISKLVDTLSHLGKAKVAMDCAPEGLFGDEYAGTVATGRSLINDNLHTLAMGIVQVLDNEQEERRLGVQASLVGVTSDELLQAREREQRAEAGGKKGRKGGRKDKGKFPLRPAYRLYRYTPNDEIYAVRLAPTGNGNFAPTGMKLYDGYKPDDDRSLEDQVAGFPTLSYDANPELLDWFNQCSASNDFMPMLGMSWPVEEEAEPAAAEEPAPEAVDATEG